MRVSKAMLVLMVVPLVVAAEEKKAPEGWKEIAPKRTTYAASFPNDGKVEESEDSIVSPKFGQIRIFRAVLERKDGSLFITGQINLPPKLTKSNVKVRREFLLDVCLDEFKGKVVETKDVKLGTMPGKEYRLKTAKGMARFRLLGTGVQMYRILVVGTKEQVESKDAEAFFDGFKRKSKIKPKPDK